VLPVLYIVGDIHLRDGTGPFPAFLDQLARRSPARLVILGDLFEYWLETSDACVRYEPVLARLRGLRAAGWRIDLVRGNRELCAGRRLEQATGCRMWWPALVVELGGHRVRIVHGDRLCQDPGYRAFAAWLGSFWFQTWQQLHPGVIQDAIARWLRTRSRATQRARAGRPAGQRKRVFIDPRRVVAAGRGCEVLVAGHIHEVWRRRVRGTDLMLVGDWPGATGRWIEGYADGRLIAASARFA
jgi:UDP-2,3-diacylglucosamine hydrolase